MAKNNKQRYKAENEAFLVDKANEEGVQRLAGGVLYRVIKEGEGKPATPRSVVSVYYSGRLINGKTFDNNTAQGYPDAMRLKDLIAGWQIAVSRMCEGDKWEIFIPSDLGYGSRGVSGIPGDSTLIFEIELVKVQ